MSENKKTGSIGEKIAANFLQKYNYKIFCLNYQNTTGRRLGEIDIIAQDKETQEIVFIEVKTRDYKKYKNTLPEENITQTKLHKIQKISQSYLYQNNLLAATYRFDAISVWINKETRIAKVKHLKNIFL